MSSKPLTFLVTRFWGSENKQPTWALDARTAAGLLLCILLFSLVGWLYLTQASQMAATGFHMQDTVQRNRTTRAPERPAAVQDRRVGDFAARRGPGAADWVWGQ